MNEIVTVLLEALRINAKRLKPCGMSFNAVRGSKGTYLYINARVQLEESERAAIRSICDNQSLLLMECNAQGAVIVIEP